MGKSADNCLDLSEPDVTADYVKNLRIVYKFVSQYFNLAENRIDEDSSLQSTSYMTTMVDLFPKYSLDYKYSLVQSISTVFSNKWIDFS